MVAIKARTLNARSKFAAAMLEAAADEVREAIGDLEEQIIDGVEQEFVNRGGNLNREDSGERGPSMAGSFTCEVDFNPRFPIRIELHSDAPHANMLDKGIPDHYILPRASNFLVIPGSRNRSGKTMVRKSVYWGGAGKFNSYARVGMERAVRAFLARF